MKTYARTPTSRKVISNGALGAAASLADELVHPRLVDGAFAELVDVEAVVAARRLASRSTVKLTMPPAPDVARTRSWSS